MPYTGKYLHKREVMFPPYRQSFHLRPSEIGYPQRNAAPRYVSSFEFQSADAARNNSGAANGWVYQKGPYNTEVSNNTESTKLNYQRKYYHAPHQHHRYQAQQQPFVRQNTLIKKQNISQSYTSLSNLRAKVTSPSGAVQYCDVLDQDAEHFNIQFQPVENGEHLVSVKNGGMHVPGSPFKIFVGNAEENAAGGAEAVQIYGGGIEGGYINKRNEFSVYTHEAGSGKLTCSIDGPSKATIEMNETGSGTFLINYSMSVPGEYMCSVKFNGDHIFGSPFRLHLEDFHAGYKGQKDHNITLASLQNQNVAVNRSSSFTIHHTGLGTGVMQAVIVSPAGNEESVDIQHLGEDNFNLKLNPKESGLHMIHVYLDGHSIPGSPFQIMVGDISAYGDGLCEGRVGETNTFWLDARTSTAGPLTVTIDGPSKVDLNCVDKDGGYEFSYIANIPGEYIISVKYGLNNHVKGSPFKAMISGVSSNQITVNKSASSRNTHVIDTKRYLNSDELHADRVFCKGDGLYRAFIGRNNQFLIDASHAENSTPFVGIIGPSRPCEEVNIRHLGGRKFQVNYFVQEYGPHDIIVRWGDREITGCPFRAYVH